MSARTYDAFSHCSPFQEFDWICRNGAKALIGEPEQTWHTSSTHLKPPIGSGLKEEEFTSEVTEGLTTYLPNKKDLVQQKLD